MISVAEVIELLDHHGGPDEPEPIRRLVDALDRAVRTWAAEPTHEHARAMAAAADELVMVIRRFRPPGDRRRWRRG